MMVAPGAGHVLVCGTVPKVDWIITRCGAQNSGQPQRPDDD